MELAIDTSSNIVGIALSHKGGIISSLTWQTRHNHTTELLPNVMCLLQQTKVELSSIEAVIVARGPGSFSGLRVGLSSAKGLALTLQIPLLGIGTFEAEAYPFAPLGLPVRAIHRAGAQEFATAVYRQRGAEWQCLEPENLASIDTIWRRTKRKTLFCGEIPTDLISRMQQNLHGRVAICPNDCVSRVSSLAMLAWGRLSRGEQDDPVTLQPLYLRPPQITKPKHRPTSLSARIQERKQGNGNPTVGC